MRLAKRLTATASAVAIFTTSLVGAPAALAAEADPPGSDDTAVEIVAPEITAPESPAPTAVAEDGTTGAADGDSNAEQESSDIAPVEQTPAVVPAPAPGAQQPTESAAEQARSTIEEVRGAEIGSAVVTEGWVTASYPTGGMNGFVIQTAGTGGVCDLDGVSDAIFVHTGSKAAPAELGAYVEVSGSRGAYQGLQQISVGSADQITVLDAPAATAEPVSCAWPAEEAQREALQSMLYLPEGDFVVTNTYDANTFGTLTLSSSGEPLRQPTDVAAYDSAAYHETVAFNEAHRVLLDDASTWRYAGGANNDKIPPFVSAEGEASVGAAVTFTDPVILDYRRELWTLNPVTQILGGTENEAAWPVAFDYNRPAAPTAESIGSPDVAVGALNVENFFTTLGQDWSVDGETCTFYGDRFGDPVSVNRCPGEGPRGAWDEQNLQRQIDKIVPTINSLDADALGLMEIENSAKLGAEQDAALRRLVAELNAAAGTEKWAYIPSNPAQLPPLAEQDVITTAVIYQPDRVTPIGEALSIADASGPGEAFELARTPIGQAFEPVGAGDPFLIVSNHFKSKSAYDDTPESEQDAGQGAYNPARVQQATALADWVEQTALPEVSEQAGEPVEDVVLVGDFNAYTFEDPMQVLYDRGYVNVNVVDGAVEGASYNYSGLNGSLDHLLVSQSASQKTTGHDIWGINSPEQIGLGYNRWEATPGDFYTPTAFRSSDHDPAIVGLNEAETTVDLNILGINDFHGRIEGTLSEDKSSLTESATVQFAGTVEQLRAEFGSDNTVFISAGDNVGASLFASSIQKDEPTIEILNALGLQASAVGNHEFDGGWEDLLRIQDLFDAPQLGANVYFKGTQDPALPEYALIEAAGLEIAVIGVVTQETPTLVSPAGVTDLDFGDPIEAVNRVTDELVAAGAADIIIAEYHEGAPDGATVETEAVADSVFGQIVRETSPQVDVIFTGHTHQEYAVHLPVPGTDIERPVVQTGSYGANVGQVVLTVDTETGAVEASEAQLVPRLTPDEASMQSLIDTYPEVAEVAEITLAALQVADEEGSKATGALTAPITRAFTGGEYVDGVFQKTEDSAENRAEASTLGTLVANSLRDSMKELSVAPDFGVVNPGGLRADLYPADDGTITVAQARAVLPFNNELSVVTLSGEQVIEMLEQQWQRDKDGNVPSRPYLQLGLSDNVRYTYVEVADPASSEGHTLGVIESVTINGEPLDPNAEYRIGTFSFLATGGDNFRVFAEAQQTVNTGLLDWESWLSYLAGNSPVSPDFARADVLVEGLGDKTLKAGTTREITVSKVDIPSVGAPLNTEVTVSLAGGEALGTGAFADGVATVTLSVPAGLTEGAGTVVIEAGPSATVASIPVAITASGDGGGDKPGKPGEKPGAPSDKDKKKPGELATTGTDASWLWLFALGGAGLVAGGYLIRRRMSQDA